MLERRKFLAGLTGLICAPAIVRASSIMPVRGWVEPDMRWFLPTDRLPEVGASGGYDYTIVAFNDFGYALYQVAAFGRDVMIYGSKGA